jgi:hypothetical protein
MYIAHYPDITFRYSIPTLLFAFGRCTMYKTLHGLVTSVLYLALKIMAYLNNFLSFVHSIFVGCSFNIIYFVIDMIFLAVQYTVQHSPR